MPGAHTPYERDFLLWTIEQAAELRRAADDRWNSGLDFSNLAEEIEDLGNNLIAVVEGLTLQILLHLLKLEHSPAEAPRSSWRDEIMAWRDVLDIRMQRAPQVHGRIDLAKLYAKARRRAAVALRRDGIDAEALPLTCPYDLDQVWGDWFPANRHGIVDPD